MANLSFENDAAPSYLRVRLLHAVPNEATLLFNGPVKQNVLSDVQSGGFVIEGYFFVCYFDKFSCGHEGRF